MRMKCKYCIDKKVASIWSQEGSNNFQKLACHVMLHLQSTLQLENLIKSQQMACPSEPDSSDETQSVENVDTKLFCTVFYAAKEGLPTNQVNNLLELQRMNGADIQYRNLSWDTLKDIQSSIKTVLQKELVSDICESEFFQ